MQQSVAMTAPVTLFTRSGVDAVDDRGEALAEVLGVRLCSHHFQAPSSLLNSPAGSSMVDKHREKLRKEKEDAALDMVRDAVPHVGPAVCVLALEGTAWDAEDAVHLLRGFQDDKANELATIQQAGFAAAGPTYCQHTAFLNATEEQKYRWSVVKSFITTHTFHSSLAGSDLRLPFALLQKRQELTAAATFSARDSPTEDDDSESEHRRSSKRRKEGGKRKGHKGDHKSEKHSNKKKKRDVARRKQDGSPAIEVYPARIGICAPTMLSFLPAVDLTACCSKV